MVDTRFIQEILSENIPVHSKYLQPYELAIQQYLKGVEIKVDPLPKITMAQFNIDAEMFPEEDNVDEGNVAIINISGLMTKWGSWWDYGAEDYAWLLDRAYEDPNIKAVVLKTHSPGGTTSAMLTLKAAILRKNKPVIMVVNTIAMSALYYNAVFCDEINVVDKMAQVGSIGIMASLRKTKKMEEMWGIEYIDVYPPESKWKNKAVNEALNGKPKLLISEELSPWAQEFQKIVRENRPNLDEEVEGIIEGRVFFAYDAIENGLVDSIMTMEEIIARGFELSDRYEISNMLN